MMFNYSTNDIKCWAKLGEERKGVVGEEEGRRRWRGREGEEKKKEGWMKRREEKNKDIKH